MQVLETKRCPLCEDTLPIDRFYVVKGKRPRYSAYCREHDNARTRANAKVRRDKVLDVLGRECVRCGFDDGRALQIDHINGGGCAEFEEFGRNTLKYYAHILENIDDYQMLCANCNQIKKFENDERPGRVKCK